MNIQSQSFKQFARMVVAVILLVVTAGSQTVSALSAQQKSNMNANIRRFDIETTAACGTPSDIPNGTTEQNSRAVFEFFTGKGLTPIQAAGIIGNMWVESQVLPQRLQNTEANVITTAEKYVEKYRNLPVENQLGWGVVQFTPAFKFIDEAPSVHEANSLGVQLDFIWAQLNGKAKDPDVNETQAGEDIKAATTLRDAVLAWQGNQKVGGSYYGYERPDDQSGSVEERLRQARIALNKYGSGASTPSTPEDGAVTPPSNGCNGGNNNSIIGGFALPVDQKWYDENPNWFTKPHHDYPSADIPVPTGTKVYAVAGGKITKAPIKTDNTSYGRGVEIDVGGGIIMIYAHGSDGGSIPGAREGDTVKAGQLIMHSASTGNSSGPHLHYEIRVNRQMVCPQTLLDAIGKESSAIPEITSLPTSGCSY